MPEVITFTSTVKNGECGDVVNSCTVQGTDVFNNNSTGTLRRRLRKEYVKSFLLHKILILPLKNNKYEKYF